MSPKIVIDSASAGKAVTQRSLSELSKQQFDLIVVGGGITGAGIAQDAASRGLKVVLVEKGDFASGTSSKSTKLIHGGLRYLQQLQVFVTLESLRERELQQYLNPSMVWSLPFIVPTYRKQWFKNFKINVGLWVYDLMAGVGKDRRHRKLPASEIKNLCPGIRTDGLTGGFAYTDCRTDDARHTLEVIKSACAHGAVALNYTRVVGFIKEQGDVRGVRVVTDIQAGSAGVSPASSGTYELHGCCVVNATGVWMQKVTELTGLRTRVHVAPAKGIHLTFSQARLPIKTAMIVPSAHDSRFCFAVPWYDSVIVGTTDDAYNGDIENLTVTAEETKYCLDALNAMFPDAKFTEADVTGSYAGLRPLISDSPDGNTSKISRQHKLDVAPDGLISIGGGKLTTYRPMAKEVVDYAMFVVAGDTPGLTSEDCKTQEIRLSGWEPRDDVSRFVGAFKQQAKDMGLADDTAEYLPTAYGKHTLDLFTLINNDPRDLKAKLVANHPYIAAQVVYAVRFEAAKTIEDVLARRIRLAITDRKEALAAADAVAAIMSQEHGWSPALAAVLTAEFRKVWDAS